MYLHQRVEPIALGGLPDVLPAVPRLVLPTRTEPGGKRRITAGEIAMCELMFKNSVDYSKVWIHNEEFLPFGLQPDDGAMTPNGEMYFNPKYASAEHTLTAAVRNMARMPRP
ncbi:hypothetical protein OU995_05800 [Roseateles sp. SL47]|uniref:hypothetical protein n=1 Tax=Roseateles sp. SL47 TaxID=2995138 RepID=UPI0022709121|nr:hypothetical protein [Roseateles sp. SL47]WAC74240.1 hypothetical protein OU995_05800 [Roseateles sp. SL47]